MKHRTILAVFLVLCCLLGACGTNEMPISVDKEISYFDDFLVSDGCVYLYCSIFLENDSEETYEVVLYGNFEEDVDGGLLTEAQLIGAHGNADGTTVLSVPPEGREFEIVFVGNYGGTYQRANRLLPEIDIVIVH